MMTKADIRRRISEQKRAMGFQTLEKRSAAVIQKIQTLEIFKAAQTVGAYMPLVGEVDITPLFNCSEKIFYLPVFNEISGGYRMAQMTEKFQKGRFGIYEPVPSVFAAEDELDLIIVPGIAFDCAGCRIGRGGGFYDRLIPQYSAKRAGICFDFQCLETIPAEPHDCRMDAVVTDIRVFKVSNEH
jgi:5-formyltetrahydrofolate cyclo-ligase